MKVIKMPGNRDWMKPIADQPYNDDAYVELSPNADTQRHPPIGTDFDAPWDYFVVENKSPNDIRICWDINASITTGQKLTTGQIGRFPRRAEAFISIYGGNGTPIPIRMFRW